MSTESIFPLLLELLAKSAAIALAATLLLRIWRGATAAQRHLVWFVALATVTVLPLTRLVSPRWAIAMQPARKVAVTMRAIPPSPVETVETEFDPHDMDRPVDVHAPVDWREAVLGCWLAGTMLVLARRSLGSWRLRRLMARSFSLNDERVGTMASGIFQELGIRRRPDLRLSAECRVPITWGILRPRMLLPISSLGWNDSWLVAALRHESAHIRRHDYLARWMAHLACAIYWPNPLVWLLARSLRVAQEQAADDLVLRAGTPPDEYATQLVNAARAVAIHGFFVRQAVAMACPSTLEYRVRAIVDGRNNRRPLGKLAASLGSLAAVFALALCAVAQLRSEDVTAREVSANTAAGESGPIVEIEAKVFEIGPELRSSEAAAMINESKRIYSDSQFQMIVRALNRMNGVDLVSAPRVVTKSKQGATIGITREFRYARDWEKNADGWKGKNFAVKNVGVTLNVTPEVQADGTIALKLKAEELDFAGYQDPDNPEQTSVAIDIQHHRALPVFSQGQIERTATLKEGEVLMLTGPQQSVDGKPIKDAEHRRRLYVFVTARIPQLEHSRSERIRPASVELPTAEITAGTPSGTGGGSVAAPPAGGPASTEIVAPLPSAKKLPEKLMTKEWKIPTNLIPPKPDGDGVERQPAKDWLIAQGVQFEAGASAIYIAATSRLIVRNTSDQLDHVDQIVSAGTPVPAAARNKEPAVAGTGGAAPESPMLTKAKRIIIPRIELREASITEAVDFLRAKAAEVDPDKTGVNIVVQPGSAADAKITMSLTKIPLAEALRYVAGLSNLELRFDPAAIVLSPPRQASSQATVEITSDTVKRDEKTGATEFSGATHLKILRPGEAPLIIDADKLTLRGVPSPGPAGAERGPAEGEGSPDPSIPPESVAEAKAIPVPGQPGYVTSPFAPKAGMIDVRPFPSGTKLKCPYTGKVIIVP